RNLRFRDEAQERTGTYLQRFRKTYPNPKRIEVTLDVAESPPRIALRFIRATVRVSFRLRSGLRCGSLKSSSPPQAIAPHCGASEWPQDLSLASLVTVTHQLEGLLVEQYRGTTILSVRRNNQVV